VVGKHPPEPPKPTLEDLMSGPEVRP